MALLLKERVDIFMFVYTLDDMLRCIGSPLVENGKSVSDKPLYQSEGIKSNIDSHTQNQQFGEAITNFLDGLRQNDGLCCHDKSKEDNMKKYTITECRECKYKVTTKDGEYNPNDIVCSYWMSDGLTEDDYCSRGVEGKYEHNETDICKTKTKAPMLRFMLDGCDISYAAEAPADMTLAQLLKQCDRIHPNYCACGIRSTDEKPELIFGYDSVDYVRGETGYTSCSIDGVNEPECQYCKYLVEATEEGWIGKCGNKNSRFYDCLIDSYNTCEWQEDKDGQI